MKLIEREAWGAPADSPAGHLPSARGTKIHYLGTPYASRAHSLCDDQVRAVRAAHLANTEEGYVDIAYTACVCEHGYVFEGRGTHRRPGANGNVFLNGQHYAVCGLVGDEGMTVPSDAMLNGLVDAVEWLRRSGDAGPEVLGHKDGFATECPGDALYAWIGRGAPRPEGPAAPADPRVYVVRPLDTLSAIARRLDVPWQDLAEVNGIRPPYTVYPGQPLRLPDKVTPALPPYPGTGAFLLGRRHPAVLAVDRRLIALGFVRHHDGNGYQPSSLFSEYTRRNVADFQRSRTELRRDPDGYVGPLTWDLLHADMPRTVGA